MYHLAEPVTPLGKAMNTQEANVKEHHMVTKKAMTLQTDFPLNDIYLSAFLALHGHEPKIILSGTRAVFVFLPGPDTNELMRRFNENATVGVAEYANSLRRLRSKMLAMRDSGRGR